MIITHPSGSLLHADSHSGPNRVSSAICPSFAIISRCTCLLGRGGCPLSRSGGLCRPEFRLVLHQRIRRARHAVGQGDRGLLGLLSLDDFPQPVFASLTPSARADLRDGTQIKQSPQIPVGSPALSDGSRSRAHSWRCAPAVCAATGMWLWGQTQPRRKVAV